MSPPLTAAEERASSTGEARDRIRIVIADDHDLYRRGMQAVIGLEPDLEIVAEAASGVEAVEKVFEYEPDVVLLDVRMPGNSGIEACTAIKEKAPATNSILPSINAAARWTPPMKAPWPPPTIPMRSFLVI